MKALVIEDEYINAKFLCDSIKEVAPYITVLEVLPSLKTARAWFSSHPEPDLIFMDIQLGDGNGFDLFSEFDIHCPVIFTTAYEEFGIKAFKNNGIDYLLKPIDIEELEAAIEKSKKTFDAGNFLKMDVASFFEGINSHQKKELKERFVIQVKDQLISLDVEKIALFYRDNLYHLLTFKGDKYILDETTLDEVEKVLSNELFFRVNRNYIINIHAIGEVKILPDSRLLISITNALAEDIMVSKNKSSEFRKWFGQ